MVSSEANLILDISLDAASVRAWYARSLPALSPYSKHVAWCVKVVSQSGQKLTSYTVIGAVLVFYTVYLRGRQSIGCLTFVFRLIFVSIWSAPTS